MEKKCKADSLESILASKNPEQVDGSEEHLRHQLQSSCII